MQAAPDNTHTQTSFQETDRSAQAEPTRGVSRGQKVFCNKHDAHRAATVESTTADSRHASE
jgi:hypothetical protein